MENGSKKWRFETNKSLRQAAATSVRGVLGAIMGNLNKEDERAVISIGRGDPSVFPCFRTTPMAEDAIVDALRSAKFNHYSPAVGLLPARGSVSDYLSRDLPYKLSPDDVFITLGCKQAIEVSLAVLARPGANILLPRPGFPSYEVNAARTHLEVRHFDLLPEKGWEIDLEAIEALADKNTVAMVIINPGNPCGNIFRYQHLKKVAETARKLGILVIADEVYGYLTVGTTPFVPMGVFGSIVPVLTLGSISKRWLVPGWRIGWLVTTDPKGVLRDSGIVESITSFLSISSNPATFIQAALPQIFENTKEDFFSKINYTLREVAEICYGRIQEIPCMTCPQKPEGSMFVMVELNLSLLEGINDDLDFCLKLAKEESVIILPGFLDEYKLLYRFLKERSGLNKLIGNATLRVVGIAVGMKNWLRVTFAIEPSALEDGFARIKAFCERHGKKQ